MNTRIESAGVTRIEIPSSNTFGWMARISRIGVRRNEFFSDRKFGGIRKAKEAALKCYQTWDEELPVAQTSHEGVLTRRNRSGTVGVYAVRSVPRSKPHLEYYFWAASWLKKDGTHVKKSFSWNRYGEEGAKELACIARDLRTQDMEKIADEYRKRHSRSGLLRHFGDVDFLTGYDPETRHRKRASGVGK